MPTVDINKETQSAADICRHQAKKPLANPNANSNPNPTHPNPTNPNSNAKVGDLSTTNVHG